MLNGAEALVIKSSHKLSHKWYRAKSKFTIFYRVFVNLERAMRFELTTFTLAR